MVSLIATIISIIVAAASLVYYWLEFREAAYRRGDVLAWANEGITALQSILVCCALDGRGLDSERVRAKLVTLMFETSALVERGRMFFRNDVSTDFGADKPGAYRGHRPEILDHLVVGFEVAQLWPEADAETRLRLRIVAETAVRAFVTLVQKEVGRSRTAAADLQKGGAGTRIHDRLKAVVAAELERLRASGL